MVPSTIGDVPLDISTWGPPTASYPNSSTCSVTDFFTPQQLVLDITLCGDWAGNAYASSGCPGTCEQAVADPTNFKGKSYYRSPFFVGVEDDADSNVVIVAKFKIKSLKVYQKQ